MWAALSAGALAFGLAGCGGDDGEETPTANASEISEAPSAEATGSATPVKPTGIEPPEKPAAMATADEEGAVAAAEYFLRMTTYAAATGDTAELEAMSGPDCQFCASFLDSIAEEYEAGDAWASVPDINIEYATTIPTDSPSSFQINMRTQKGSYDYFNEKDGLRHGSPESFVMAIVATYDSGPLWRIEAVQDFPSDTEIPGEHP